jgi:tetratricopeptide (TPR) repeat protein
MHDRAPLTGFVILGFMLVLVFAAHQDAFSQGQRPLIEASMRQTGNQISGHVFDDARRPVPQLYVELMNDLYQTIARTRTDSSGFYVFGHLSSGRFKLKVLVTGTGYTEQVQDVEINNFTHQTTAGPASSKEFRELDFYLKVKGESRGVATSAAPGVVFAQEVPAEAKKIYENALRDLDGKRDAQGLQELKKSIELFPTYYAALERLGTEYARRGEYPAAVVLLRKAIEVFARGYQSLYSLGVALYNLNELATAIEMFDRATVISPNSVNSQLWLGKSLREKGQYERAEPHLKRANELGKNRVPEAHWQLALLYNHTKRNREAADELETYLKLKPDAPNAESIKEMIRKLREKTGYTRLQDKER